jgi:hypothetical protein
VNWIQIVEEEARISAFMLDQFRAVPSEIDGGQAGVLVRTVDKRDDRRRPGG